MGRRCAARRVVRRAWCHTSSRSRARRVNRPASPHRYTAAAHLGGGHCPAPDIRRPGGATAVDHRGTLASTSRRRGTPVTSTGTLEEDLAGLVCLTGHWPTPDVHPGNVVPGRRRRDRASVTAARSSLDAIVVGAGPNGLAAAADTRTCRTLGPGVRGGRVDRRWDTDRGADTPRVPSRRLLVDRAARPCLAILPDGRLGGARCGVHPARRAARPRARCRTGRSSSSGRSPRLLPTSMRTGGPTMGRPGDGCSGRSPAMRPSSGASSSGRSSTSRGIHWRWPDSACRRFGLPPDWRVRAFAAMRRGRCSWGWPRIRCCGSIDP